MTALILGLGGAWGLLAAWPVLRRTRRHLVVDRFETPTRARRRQWSWGPIGRVVSGLRTKRLARGEAAKLDRELPAALDLLVVAVGAGAPPRGAVEVAARWAPPRVARPLQQVLVATDLGGSLAEALEAMAVHSPALAPIADVLVTSARLGAPAAGALSRLAEEARSSVRRRAEARARVLPVKLLFPLVFLVLPAFGLLTVAPALISALSHL